MGRVDWRMRSMAHTACAAFTPPVITLLFCWVCATNSSVLAALEHTPLDVTGLVDDGWIYFTGLNAG